MRFIPYIKPLYIQCIHTIRKIFQHLTWRQYGITGFLLSVLLGSSISLYGWHHHTTHRETFQSITPRLTHAVVKPPQTLPITALSQQITSLSETLSSQIAPITEQLHMLQQQINSLKTSFQTLSLRKAAQPHTQKLLNQMQQLQISVNNLLSKKNKVEWLPPDTAHNAFHLVAVQGFSDGVRAVIDISGHQTTLALQESCPACQGWQLQQLDFIHQRALFQKQHGKKVVRVWLSMTPGDKA